MSGCLRKSVLGSGTFDILRRQRRAANSKRARPLRAEQHIILPDAVGRKHAVKDRIHVLGRIGQWRFANNLAFERIVLSEFQLERRIRIPWERRCCVLNRAIHLAFDAEEIVRSTRAFSPRLQSLSGTFFTCSNDVQIHCGRATVLCTAWKPIRPSVLSRHGRFAFVAGGIKTSALTHVEVLRLRFLRASKSSRRP